GGGYCGRRVGGGGCRWRRRWRGRGDRGGCRGWSGDAGCVGGGDGEGVGGAVGEAGAGRAGGAGADGDGGEVGGAVVGRDGVAGERGATVIRRRGPGDTGRGVARGRSETCRGVRKRARGRRAGWYGRDRAADAVGRGDREGVGGA